MKIKESALTYRAMSSFLYSLLVHVALAAAVVASNSEYPNQPESVQVQVVQNQKPNRAVKPYIAPAKPMKYAANSQTKNEVNEKSQEPSQEASTDSVINLEQGGNTTDRIFSYLVTQIYKNRIYPYESIRLKQQGHVTMSFYINETGELVDISIVQPSEFKQLNSAAVRTLKTLKLSREVPDVELLFKRRYSFTFDFELVKTL